MNIYDQEWECNIVVELCCATMGYMSELDSKDVASVFGANLKRLRESRGWSQSELARQMQEVGWKKYSQVSVSRTEEGSRTVRLDEAIDLANVLQRRVDDLLDSESVVSAWAQLRFYIEIYSDGIDHLRASMRHWLDAHKELSDLASQLKEAIGSEGGDEKVSETMSKTLENAEKILPLDPHYFLDQVLSDIAETGDAGKESDNDQT